MKKLSNPKIIVDANIVFSGILKSNSKIGDLLINHYSNFEFIAPYYLRGELAKYHRKLSKISGLSLAQVIEAEFQICKGITFISEEQITAKFLAIAEKLVEGVDEKDILYVAFSKQFKCKIWSGDKVLIKGIAKKGFDEFVTADDLLTLL